MKLLISILLLLIMVIPAFSFSGKGSGSKSNPYQITNIHQLQEMKDSTIAYYILMNDIDASETRNWNIGDHDLDTNTPDEPMGFEPIGFGGDFNGDGHIIKNLFINRPGYGGAALFSYYTGGDWKSIRYLGIENCNIIGGDYVGGLVGNCESSNIKQCYTTGKVKALGILGVLRAGGFCGNDDKAGDSFISDCYSECLVIADSAIYIYQVASFNPGYQSARCYTIGKVDAPNPVHAFGNNEQGNYCLWDVEKTGIPDTGANHLAMGLTTKEMMQSFYYKEKGWDFDNVWYIDEGKDYPRLRAFKRDTTGIVKQNMQTENAILDVSPNPCHSIAEIIYSISIPGTVTITLFNSLGICVKELMNENIQDTGKYKMRLDASDISSGIYFLLIKNDWLSVARQLVVIK